MRQNEKKIQHENGSKAVLKKRIRKRYLIAGLFLLTIFVAFWFCVPRPLFRAPLSVVLESSEGNLLGARIAADGQWRFPKIENVPGKYEKCLLLFEDRYFYAHPGINPFSLFRAFIQNAKAGKIVRGGSTITMQVCRMARGPQKRSLTNKIIEIIWALNIELRHGKKEILKLYASHAPYGGNVVGLEAAAWRYFDRSPADLSWAEAATLAVLPNAPSLIYPGKSDEQLGEKRNALLRRLLENGELDSLTCSLAIAEPLPEKVKPLSTVAYHLVERAVKEREGRRVQSTINYHLQHEVASLVRRHHKKLEANSIHNAAVLVAEVSTRQVKAYVGNVFGGEELQHGQHVDVIQAPRSTGSILKPLLYCKMLDEGQISPQMLIPDIPTRFGGFTPSNFDQQFGGAVPAAEALSRSLNIPAVHLLRDFGIPPFHRFLKEAGMKSLNKDPGWYGLSLILGGAEISLWSLAGIYTSLAHILKNYEEHDGIYEADPFQELIWEKPAHQDGHQMAQARQPKVRAASVYCTLEALLNVKRPGSEAGWQEFASARNIAWKTGTSFGFRDAWAVGVTRNHVVAVWVGNADGEGRQGLTGVSAAAPLLFDVFALLPDSRWFSRPVDEMELTRLCAQSGYPPGMNCEQTRELWLPSGMKLPPCPWHRIVHLNEAQNHRVSASCYPVAKMVNKKWFVLPPAMEYYYKTGNPMYATVPPLLEGCRDELENMEFVYPREWTNLFVPTDLDGTPGQLIFDLAHRNSQATVFWQLDETYLGKTTGIHQMAVSPENGWHLINVTDQSGNQLVRRFFVAGNED